MQTLFARAQVCTVQLSNNQIKFMISNCNSFIQSIGEP